MCNACDRVPGGLRKEPLNANEVAFFNLLKRKPPAKLPALLPSWVKSHLRAVMPPKQFVFVPHAAPVFPNYLTKQLATPRAFPDTTDGLEEYIKQYEEMNHLLPVQYQFSEAI